MKNISGLPSDQYFKILEEEIKPEFKRLYYADSNCEYLNLKSLKTMMYINRQHRFIAFHQFYINIEL